MPRNLVICLDGTWNTLSTDPGNLTNIHLLSKLARYESGTPNMKDQIVYYADGVGAGPLLVDRYINGALGKGVFKQARDAWEFVRNNHRAGDKIFIFGFSRGAYAARHLAGMITRCGISNKPYEEVEKGFRKYLTVAGTSSMDSEASVEFLGLFDCVPANYILLKLNRKIGLNSPELEKGIDHFRHALAKDERRYSFYPLIFNNNAHHQSFDQVVFPGYHGDVGGGGPSNAGLARIPLWWMMREAYGVGLDFNIVTCRIHHAGNATFIGSLDPGSKPVCSDYLTTRLGIKHPRQTDLQGLNAAPELIDMDSCPRCKKDMFDALAIPHYNNRLNKFINP